VRGSANLADRTCGAYFVARILQPAAHGDGRRDRVLAAAVAVVEGARGLGADGAWGLEPARREQLAYDLADRQSLCSAVLRAGAAATGAQSWWHDSALENAAGAADPSEVERLLAERDGEPLACVGMGYVAAFDACLDGLDRVMHDHGLDDTDATDGYFRVVDSFVAHNPYGAAWELDPENFVAAKIVDRLIMHDVGVRLVDAMREARTLRPRTLRDCIQAASLHLWQHGRSDARPATRWRQMRLLGDAAGDAVGDGPGYQPHHPDARACLMSACEYGDLENVRGLLADGVPPTYGMALAAAQAAGNTTGHDDNDDSDDNDDMSDDVADVADDSSGGEADSVVAVVLEALHRRLTAQVRAHDLRLLRALAAADVHL
jgi:hypothetical protein